MTKIINILGYGDVVKAFVKTFAKNLPNLCFEIYCSSLPINYKTAENIVFRNIYEYQQNDHPTFFCCSIDEAKALELAKDQSSRLTVAVPNLKLIRQFIQKGFFNSGLHFILTNPSELITEYIIRQTHNKNIFALGLSVDEKRYLNILPQFNIDPLKIKFNLIGNHWDFPLINFEDDFAHNKISILERLMLALKNKIRTEFNGFKPPIESGAIALYDAILSLSLGKHLSVSGFIEAYGIVGGGVLNINPLTFTQPKINIVANTLLSNVIDTHKETYNHLMEKIA